MKFRYLLITLGGLFMASCHNPVYEDEGDCDVAYNLRFVYDMNLKWADAFPSEVHSVRVYVYDSEGLFVKEIRDAGPALAEPGYSLRLDLKPGDYTFVAWCGLDNEDVKTESFTVSEPVAGVSTLNDLTCSLNTVKQDGNVISRERLNFLYHGNIEASLPDSQDGKDYYYTIPLIKDTNHIRVILQQLSAENMIASDYEFSIDAQDEAMAWDNSLIGDINVEYLPWAQATVSAGIGSPDEDSSEGIVYADGVYADLSTARLMASQQDSVFLYIKNSATGESIAKIPVLQYALLSRSYYEEAYGHIMTPQEFLDREDEYVMTFFLDRNGAWISSVVEINSWRIVIHDYDM